MPALHFIIPCFICAICNSVYCKGPQWRDGEQGYAHVRYSHPSLLLNQLLVQLLKASVLVWAEIYVLFFPERCYGQQWTGMERWGNAMLCNLHLGNLPTKVRHFLSLLVGEMEWVCCSSGNLSVLNETQRYTETLTTLRLCDPQARLRQDW